MTAKIFIECKNNGLFRNFRIIKTIKMDISLHL